MDDANLSYCKAVFEMVTAVAAFLTLVWKVIAGRKPASGLPVLKMAKMEASPL